MKPLHPNLLRTISAVWVSGALALLTGLTDLSDPAPLQAASPEPEEVAKAPAPAAPKELSAKAAEVMRLTESGVEEAVVLAYIEQSPARFELSAEDIIYLKDLGIEAPIITAMLRHDSSLPRAPAPGQKVEPAPIPDAPTVPTAPSPPEPTPVMVTNAPTQVTYFYESLAPYGTWVEVNGLGWCWQPRAVTINQSWRPYCDSGQWIYSDSGWYWYSDYSWGWAPFHYGRWHHHDRHGWVWFPDLVWAPAWVCWRYSDAYCGWAPLPPGSVYVTGHGWRYHEASVGINFDFHLSFGLYSFVEIGHFHERHPSLHLVPPNRAREIHGSTTVVNNHAPGPNQSIRNPGISVDRISAVTHHEIRPVPIKELSAPAVGQARRAPVTRDGTPTTLYRAKLPPPARKVVPSAQRVDDRTRIVRPVPGPAPLTSPRSSPPPAVRRSSPSNSTPQGGAAQRPHPASAASAAPQTPSTRSTSPPAPQAPAQKPKPGPDHPQDRGQPAALAPPRSVSQPVTPQAAVPAGPLVPSTATWVQESPKGREQRISIGRPIPAVPPTAGKAPAAPSHPHPQQGQRPPP